MPGPVTRPGAWIDDFEGNNLNRKWVATRYSSGGQNDGQWERIIKDSKIYSRGVNGGTETGLWGEVIMLPVNAPGDIIIEALVRHKRTAPAVQGELNICVNNIRRNGTSLALFGGLVNFKGGLWAGAPQPWPGFPSRTLMIASADELALMRMVRTNGNMRMYIDGHQFAGFAYAATITSVDINIMYNLNDISTEKWIDYISIYPGEVVT